MRDILAAALRANPDDRPLSAAFADYMIEAGDPRGELIRLQLLAEDPDLSVDDKIELGLEVEELMRLHGGQWLGGLADLLLRGIGALPRVSARPLPHWWFERGWLAGIEVGSVTPRGVRALASARETALIRDLSLAGFHDRDNSRTTWPYYSLVDADASPLATAGVLANLRRFRLGVACPPHSPTQRPSGWSDHPAALTALLRGMPNLRTLELNAGSLPSAEVFALPTFTRLTELDLVVDAPAPASLLAENPALIHLERLTLTAVGATGDMWEPPDGLPRDELVPLFRSWNLRSLKHLAMRGSTLGDRGVEALTNTKMLRRLETLELSHGVLTDAAADMLAAHPDTPRLERLDLSGNAISAAALDRLRATGVPVVEGEQRSADAHVGPAWTARRRVR